MSHNYEGAKIYTANFFLRIAGYLLVGGVCALVLRVAWNLWSGKGLAGSFTDALHKVLIGGAVYLIAVALYLLIKAAANKKAAT